MTLQIKHIQLTMIVLTLTNIAPSQQYASYLAYWQQKMALQHFHCHQQSVLYPVRVSLFFYPCEKRKRT